MDLKLLEKILNNKSGKDTCTVMGWIPKFDDKGRPVNADLNICKDFSIVDNHYYLVVSHVWKIFIYDLPEEQVKTLCKDDKGDPILMPNTKGGDRICVIDFKPDYLDEKISKEEIQYPVGIIVNDYNYEFIYKSGSKGSLSPMIMKATDDNTSVVIPDSESIEIKKHLKEFYKESYPDLYPEVN